MRTLLAFSGVFLFSAFPVVAQTPRRSSCNAAETSCGLPGVKAVVSPACAAPGQVVLVTLKNDSDETITLPSGCIYIAVHPGTACASAPVLSPPCTFSLVPIPPGGSCTRPWFQNDNQGGQVPPGTYSFTIWYYDAGYANLIECCPEVTISSSCIRASAVPRNGSGSNPQTLASVHPPQLGTSWVTNLDCTAHAPGLAFLFVFDSPASGTFTPSGEILVGGSRVLCISQPHAGSIAKFSVPVPPNIALCGRRAYSQGVCGGAPGPRRSNALDLVLWD